MSETYGRNKNVLFIVTNCDKMGDSGTPTGCHLSEIAIPWKIMRDAGFAISFASIQGGRVPLDPNSLKQGRDDHDCQQFLDNPEIHSMLENSQSIGSLSVDRFDGVYFPGGHGPMFDIAFNDRVGELVAQVYEKGGVVGGVCHGPAGLLRARLSGGQLLVDGRRVTCFTNEEERQAGYDNFVPFPLESKLKELGARFSFADPGASNVVVDGRLITGQNPASAPGLARAIVTALLA